MRQKRIAYALYRAARWLYETSSDARKVQAYVVLLRAMRVVARYHQ